MTSPEDLPLRNGEDSGNTDNGVVRERGQRTLKGDGYSANMKRLDDLNKDLAEFNKAKKFEDYMKSIHEAQVAGDDALLDKLITQHEAEVQAEYEKAQEEKRAREQAYEQMSDEEKRQNYEQELAQSQAEYDANHPEGAENGDPAEAEAGKNEPVTLEETVKKHHKSKAAKKALVVGIATAIATVGTIVVANIFSGGSKSSGGDSPSTPEPTPTTVTAPEAPEIPVAVGEKEKPKLKYDYSEWRDFANKSSDEAYGADYSDCYNDPEKTTEGFLGEAEKMPEALASYKGAFFEDEQKELGIFDMTREELDNAMSDVNSEDSAIMQQNLLDAMGKILDDKENTKWVYNIENDKENSSYVIWEDKNSDGVQTPDEMHLGYRDVSRHNAPQANLYRRDKNGNWVKMLDLNLYCGFQPNTPVGEKPDVPYIPEGEKAPTKDDNKKDKPTEGDDKKEDKPTEDDNKGGETPTTSPTPEYPIITTPSEPPVTVLASKNEENFNRIAADTEKSHEEDLHIVDYTPFRDADVTKVEDITKEPTAENYEGTTPAIARNEKAEESEPVGRDHLWVSIPENETPPSPVGEKNDYGDNLGGANDQNARENPVESNQESQNQAGQNRIPDNELPGAGDQGTRDLLAELGIF